MRHIESCTYRYDYNFTRSKPNYGDFLRESGNEEKAELKAMQDVDANGFEPIKVKSIILSERESQLLSLAFVALLTWPLTVT